MLNLLKLIRNSKLYLWVAGVVFALAIAWGEHRNRSGRQAVQDRVEKERLEREAATRERARKANEKISSNPSFISKWLRDNKRFRD